VVESKLVILTNLANIARTKKLQIKIQETDLRMDNIIKQC